jgi:hypothetical protein
MGIVLSTIFLHERLAYEWRLAMEKCILPMTNNIQLPFYANVDIIVTVDSAMSSMTYCCRHT